MFEIFSNTVENKHAKEIGTDYDVDPNSWGTIGKFKLDDVFLITCGIYSIR